MDRCSLKNPGEEIIPETFDLHVLAADQSKIDQHIQPHKQLYYTPGIFISLYEQEYPQSDRETDITEIQQLEDIALCQPQYHSNSFEQQQNQQRMLIFPQMFHDSTSKPVHECFTDVSISCNSESYTRKTRFLPE